MPLSTITSTQVSEVSLGAIGRKHDPGDPGSELWSGDSLDTLYNLAGQYRSRHEGDKMLVNYENENIRDADSFLWRYRERGILRLPGRLTVRGSLLFFPSSTSGRSFENWGAVVTFSTSRTL